MSAREALAPIEQQWAIFEKAAANQRIPRVWIEPVPALTKNQPLQ